MPDGSHQPGSGRRDREAADSRLGMLRELGEQAVLETIFREGPITRPEISAATSLSKPTVSAAVSRLEHAGLVRAAGTRPGQRGRKPVAYVVSKRAGFVLGADIGGTNVRVAAADLFGEADLRPQAPDHQGRQPRRRRADARDDQRGDRPGRRLPRASAGARDVGPRRDRSQQRSGHVACLQRHARRRVRSARRDPGALRPARADRQQRQPRGGRGEVVRAGARNLDARVHRDRRRDRDGRDHRRRARARRPRRRRRDRLPAARRRPVRPAPPPARGARGRGRGIRDPGRVQVPPRGRGRGCRAARTRCSSWPARATRSRGRSSTTSRRCWVRRSRRCARSSIPSSWCSAAGSARAPCCCALCGERRRRSCRSPRGSRPACSATARPFRERSRSRCRLRGRSC